MALCAACSASTKSGPGVGDVYGVLAFVALVAGVLLLKTVAHVMGELITTFVKLTAALAKMGLVVALIMGAIVLAIAMLTQA